MVEITDAEYELFTQLKTIWKHSVPEQSGAYFICGSSTDKDEQGLPEMIMVCPAMGLDHSVMYRKVEKSDS